MSSITIPKNKPIPVGEIIEEEYRKAIGMTQQQFADALGISRVRYAEIAKGKRGVTVDTAFRLARLFSTSPQFWLNMQLVVDIWEMQHSPVAAAFKKIKPIKATA